MAGTEENVEIKGSIHKFGDDVNTDVIIPARYLSSFDMAVLKVHCMEDIYPDFMNKMKPGDIIVAGKNFGCGSSREHAPAVIKEAGVSCVIAKSFARIFYRNAINIGLPIMECPEICDECNQNDTLQVDLRQGKIYNITSGKEYLAAAFPDFIMGIINAGGLLNYLGNLK